MTSLSESEPLYLQSQWVLRNACGWIQITQIVVTGDQSLEAKWAPGPGNREGRGQPKPTLSTDATNGNEQRGWPLPCSLGIPETSLMFNSCLSFRSQSFQTSKTVLEPPGLYTAHAWRNRPMSLLSPTECGSSWGRPTISRSLFTAFAVFL